MSVIRPAQPSDKASAVSPEIEGEIRDFVRRESSRQSPDRESPRQSESEVAANSISDTIRRVAGASVAEIDRVIVELTQLRDHLQNEGRRVEGEIAGYAQTSQVAVQSLKEIGQSLGQFKRAARTGPPASPR